MPWHRTMLSSSRSTGPPVQPFTIDGRALVAATWDGDWYVVEDRCSHAGCAFSDDGTVEDGRLVCDCHGSEFDIRTGEVVAPPASAPIATFPVRVVAGTIEVDL